MKENENAKKTDKKLTFHRILTISHQARTKFMRRESQKSFLIALFLTMATACSSTTIVQEKPTLPEVPEYVKVPHPSGFELSSLRSIFFSPLAPTDVHGEFVKTCDVEFMQLARISNSIEERTKAAEELVSTDPERMHWCFYAKISRLQETLQTDSTWTERQKQVFETYTFITPLANSFLNVYNDSRYLRWATQYYTKISEWVFYRKVIPSSETTERLLTGVNTDALDTWIPVENKKAREESVFAKYGISLIPSVASGANPLDFTSRYPASVESKPDAPPSVSEKPMTEGVDLQLQDQQEKATIGTP